MSTPDHVHSPPRRYHDVAAAATTLGLGTDALRARCRRAAVREGGSIVAHLGGGIVAFRLGRTWRIKFPAEPTDGNTSRI